MQKMLVKHQFSIYNLIVKNKFKYNNFYDNNKWNELYFLEFLNSYLFWKLQLTAPNSKYCLIETMTLSQVSNLFCFHG